MCTKSNELRSPTHQTIFVLVVQQYPIITGPGQWEKTADNLCKLQLNFAICIDI